MSDSPEKVTCGSNHKNIFLNHIADRVTWSEFPQGTHSVEYIRSDLVPQWQPFETMPDRPGQVFLSTPNGCYNVGTVLDQWVFL